MLESIIPQLEAQAVELSCCAPENPVTRIAIPETPVAPRSLHEMIAGTAKVREFTGLTASVGIHLSSDNEGDYAELAAYAEELGLRVGSVSSNTPPADGYRLGSLTNTDQRIRQDAIDHHYECIDIMDQTGAKDLRIRLADGTDYPGQADIRHRQELLGDSLASIYARLGKDQRLVLGYRFPVPFHHADVPDWGTSYVHVAALGDRATVCVGTGYDAAGTNIEFIVAQLLRLNKLGAFDFTPRSFRDEDVVVGAADPFQLFRILHEVARREAGSDGAVTFMLQQCKHGEDQIAGQIRSVLVLQQMMVRALLVDATALRAAQNAGDALGANGILMEAFYTDVRPLLADWRASRGLPTDPLAAYVLSAHGSSIATESSNDA